MSQYRQHERDNDCVVDEQTGCCVDCGVDHSGRCVICDGRGFHRNDCPKVRRHHWLPMTGR